MALAVTPGHAVVPAGELQPAGGGLATAEAAPQELADPAIVDRLLAMIRGGSAAPRRY